MDSGQLRAAKAAERRRAQLGLTQKQTGVDPKTWKQFVEGDKWPGTVLTRSRIEAHLDLKLGALTRIAEGKSALEQEALRSEVGGAGGEYVPSQLPQMFVLLNEAEDHYRSQMRSLGDLKVQMARDLAERILHESPERQTDTP